ncbi:hypothetical protein PGTUg99_004772 [Puccinia graminis f. sp. tritici]|uniref:Uncharacterized protein n=1 Tax=Puccinia graminis f. sp. tritici TaxID=56615 RepID=A0A5B0QYL3_PUCGR|nr:hypothetical protein PGTUg99_004772 [Puccinia graminis f. sp. tritici]
MKAYGHERQNLRQSSCFGKSVQKTETTKTAWTELATMRLALLPHQQQAGQILPTTLITYAGTIAVAPAKAEAGEDVYFVDCYVPKTDTKSQYLKPAQYYRYDKDASEFP